MKRGLLLFLSIAMIFSVLPVPAQAAMEIVSDEEVAVEADAFGGELLGTEGSSNIVEATGEEIEVSDTLSRPAVAANAIGFAPLVSEWTVIKLVNIERERMGLKPLTAFGAIQEAAGLRADEQTSLYSHTRPDGSSCFTVFDEYGLSYNRVAENIAKGFSSAISVNNAWVNSAGHYENMLREDVQHIGVGRNGQYWVELFIGHKNNSYKNYFEVVQDQSSYPCGTSIEEMDMYAIMVSSKYGDCYLPIRSAYCTGYDPSVVGTQTVKVSALGFTTTVKIKTTGHEEVIDEPVAATCTETGLTEGKHCATCGKTITKQNVIAATGHSYGGWSEYKAPGCTEEGEERRYCENCDTYESRQTDAAGHDYRKKVTEPTCADQGYTTHTCIACGDSYRDSYTEATNDHTYSHEEDASCNVCGHRRAVTISSKPMYRLYNPNSGEHFYTGSIEERDMLVGVGWNYEGIAWNAPIKSGDPVYRLFNPNNSDHHYTMSAEERDNLVNVGWQYEGVCWNSATPDNLPLYRLYNPNADCGSHHYTGSTEERDNLVSVGWIYEGIGWYGVRN